MRPVSKEKMHMHTHIFEFSFKHCLQRKLAGAVGALRHSMSPLQGRHVVWAGQIIHFQSMSLSSPDWTGLGLHLDLLVLGPREGLPIL